MRIIDQAKRAQWGPVYQPAAFIGDLVFDGTHSYIADGHSKVVRIREIR